MSTLQTSRLLSLPSGIRTALLALPAARHTIRPSPAAHSSRSYATTNTASQPQSSINPDEVSHFNVLAGSWWDPHGSSRLLHLMNPLRHDFIRRCHAQEIRDPNQKLRYLDVGCGGGIFAESAARRLHTESMTAIDPTPEVIAVARRHQRHDPLLLEKDRLTYLNIPIEDHHPEKLYDVISVFEVVEHIQHPSPFLSACLKRLKPGGWLVGSTIARTNTSWFTTKIMAEDVLGIVPRGTHDWNQYIQPSEMKDWAKRESCLSTDPLSWQTMGVIYVPGVGWKEVKGSESWGNYFFGVKKRADIQ